MAEHSPMVMRVCRALLAAGDAEDAWSEAFLSAMQAYPRLRADSNVAAWLVTIAHRKAIDQLRAATRRPRPVGAVPELQAPDNAPRTRDGELRAELEALPAKQRGAVIYRYLADLPYHEVAALLDCSEAAARRSAADGLAKLRTRYLRGTTT